MLTIRRAALPDAAGIARVHVDAWRETYRGIVPDDHLAQLSIERREAMWRNYLAKPAVADSGWGDSSWVAEDAGRIVGFVNAGKTRSPELPFAGELYAIYLLKAFQGQGIGAGLFARSAQDLIAAGQRTAMLWVLADNPTVNFYRHMGGRPASEKTETIGGAPLLELALGYDEAALTTIGNRAPSA